MGLLDNLYLGHNASFGGMSLDHDALDRVAAEWRQRADVA